MFRILFIGGLLMTMTLFGCQQSEQTQPAQTPSAPQQIAPEEKAPETIVTTADESNERTVEPQAKTLDDVIEKAVEASEETAVEAIETAQDDAAVVRDQAAAEVQAGKAAVDTVVTTVASTDNLEDVVFKGTFGTVTMSHQIHAAFDCAQCHGEGTPGTLDLGREAAHDLCIGCHKEQNAGPTACAACHIR